MSTPPRIRSLFTCPLQQASSSGAATSSRPLPPSVSTPSVISVPASACQQENCRIVATHAANICHLISHTVPSHNDDRMPGAPAKVADSRVTRCRIALDREIGAVAVAGGNGGTITNERTDDESPVLLIADISGRLWKSRPKEAGSSTGGNGIAFTEGWLSVGRDADTAESNMDGPSFDMVQLKPGRGRRRCLPLGVDQMSICQGCLVASNDGGGSRPLDQEGILMVAAGSQSISPPTVVFVPNANNGNAGKKVILEDISGLETERGQIVSSLMVSRNAIGIASWRRLLRAMADSKDTNGVDATANSAVVLGMSDGSVYCSLVFVRHVAKVESNRLQVESVHVTSARKIHRMTPNQGVASIFLVPNDPFAKKCVTASPNLLVIVGCLGSVSALLSSSRQADVPLFTSQPAALPSIGTCTSACPYQYCQMEQGIKEEKIEFTIMATFDDGSSFSCPLAIDSVRQGPKLQNGSPATRLPIRRDAAMACSDLHMSGSHASSEVYMFSFGGSLVGLRAEIQRQTGSSQVDQPLGGSKASFEIMTALKRLCDATNMDTTAAKATKPGVGLDKGIGAIQETRDAARVVSRLEISKCQDADKWFQTRHIQQAMLSDLVDSQPPATKDLAALYYIDRDGDSIKVAYAGVALNECTSLQQRESSREVQESAFQWNGRPMVSSSTLSCTFEHLNKKGMCNVKVGTRIQDDHAPTPSKRKRKLQSLTGFSAGKAKSAYSDGRNEEEILGLVAGTSNLDRKFPPRWSSLADAISEMIEGKGGDNISTGVAKPRTVGSCTVEAEGAMILGEIFGRSGKTKVNVTGHSILLSSCSAIAKKCMQKKTLSLGDSSATGLDSISIEAVPTDACNGDGSTKLRYDTTPSRLELDDSSSSTLPLLRLCIVDLLAKRVSAPGEASIPLGEMEAVTLLDSYHKAIKNPRTKKMAMYLVMKTDELLAKMKRQEGRSTENDGADGEPVYVESVLLLYNQLRAIPLPLG